MSVDFYLIKLIPEPVAFADDFGQLAVGIVVICAKCWKWGCIVLLENILHENSDSQLYT